MRHLLAATCLTPVVLAFGLAAPAAAEAPISTTVTSPLRTSTAGTGGTSDDIRVTSTGIVRPSGGAAITIDSNENVTNEGTIQVTGANDSTGILALPGFSGNITNAASGKIIIDETYTATDADKDGDLDGPFAQGSGRYGIRIAPGGTFTGNVSSAGGITIEGNNSAAIALDSTLNGALSHSGVTDVLGDNSVGIRAGDVTGNVTVNGSVSVRGANAVGVALDGDIGGRLVVQGTVTSTGYRAPSTTHVLSKLDSDDMLQGGPAFRVAGNVAGGILFDAPPPDLSTTDPDEDKDGIPDANETTATVRSAGAAPAVVIGSASEDIVIGAVPGTGFNGHGIVNRGVIGGDGAFSGIAANGLVIGGLGRTVQVAGGLTNNGSIGAAATNADAIALRIGGGATLPEIRNGGIISATGAGTAASRAEALAIDSGASLPTLRNSGRIEAAAIGAGTVTAIADRSGTLALIENSGIISAAGPASAVATATDLSANTTGATIRQVAPTSGGSPVRITGAVRFGAGNDVFEVSSGTVTGTTSFGAGADRLSLSGAARYTGDVDFAGGGADAMTLAGTSVFTGRLLNSGGVALDVSGGSLLITSAAPIALTSLNVGATGALGVTIDPGAGAHTRFNVAGQASFAQGSEIVVTLTRTHGAEGNYLIVDAAGLTGTPNLGLDTAVLPYLFVGSLSADQAAGDLSLNIRRRTAAELGLNGSETAAYGAVYAALAKDSAIEGSFLRIQDEAGFRTAVQQMLPDHAGGAFETVTQASRATARFLADPRPPIIDAGDWGFFIQQVAWGTSKDLGDTSAYRVDGWGASGGLEFRTGAAGAFGVTAAYLLGRDRDSSTDNEVTSSQYELGAYWRGNVGPLAGFVRGSAARINFSSDRAFVGTDAGGVSFRREAEGAWSGNLFSAGAGLSYEIRSGRLNIRPAASIDHYRLDENNYAETGPAGFALLVDERSSDETAANGSLTVGYSLSGDGGADGGWMRIEAEGGRREILSGSLGATTAHFDGGANFTLTPEERTSGWTGRLRVIGGNRGFRFGAEVGAEEQQGRAAISGRLTLHSTF